MATQYRKLVKKLNPKPKKNEPPPEKIGKDYWLVAILLLTIFFLIVGWANFDNVNRALYVALIVSLGATYARRHFNLNDMQESLTEKISLIGMIAAIILFVVEIYTKFIA